MSRREGCFEHRTPRGWARLWGTVTLWCALSGCGAQTEEPDVDGQSHWWKLCGRDADCAQGFQCACGACTRACTAVDACGSTQHVQCSLRAGFCNDEFEVAEANVCQVSCTESSHCPDSLTCHAGLCVSAQVVKAQEANSSSGLEQAGDTAPVCGEPPRECPPPPVDWCTSRSNTPFPEEVVAYWSSFCDAGVDASVVASPRCGDGILSADEVCDDGNTVSGDGCASTCDSIEGNFDCFTPGQPCEPG